MTTINPDYHWQPSPNHYDQSCHKYPCPETDHIDKILNQFNEQQAMRSAEKKECTIQPTEEEIRQACNLGRQRRTDSDGFNDRIVSKLNPIFVDASGVLAESMTCKYLGLRYEFPLRNFRAADLPYNIEVRSTQWFNGHCKVRPDDDDSRRIVMAIVPSLREPVFLAGWIIARDGKQFSARDPHAAQMPMHFVPQSALLPMRELKQLIRSEKAHHAQ